MTGAIVLATDQGLGYLAKSFFDNGIIQKVFIKKHSSRTNHREWYPGESVVPSIDVLLEECETIFAIETFFDWTIIPKARAKGKKTVLMPMYECTPNPLPYKPDVILSPSLLDWDYFPGSTHVTVPTQVKWKLRTKARTYVHNAGNGGLGGRNGTALVLEAMKHVKSPIKLILRSQVAIRVPDDPRIDYRKGTFDNIWSEGDVFLFPEAFNGLSLPLQEAHASGMLVMAGDRYPMNTWLPKEPLIPSSGWHKERHAVGFGYTEYDPKAIASSIDYWYNQDISSYSRMGREWGKQNSWKKLKEKYATLMLP